LALRHTHRKVLDECCLEQRLASWQDVRYRVRKLFRHARRLERDGTPDGLDRRLSAIYDELLSGMTGRGVSKEMCQLPKSDAGRLNDAMRRVVAEPAATSGTDGVAQSPVLSTHE
jgi:hypothetical protein